MYSGAAWFESWQGLLTILICSVVFLSHFRWMMMMMMHLKDQMFGCVCHIFAKYTSHDSSFEDRFPHFLYTTLESVDL
jgi:hypothetical protein